MEVIDGWVSGYRFGPTPLLSRDSGTREGEGKCGKGGGDGMGMGMGMRWRLWLDGGVTLDGRGRFVRAVVVAVDIYW